MRPPTIKELLVDESYRQYLRTPPALPENLKFGFPWRLWVEVATSSTSMNEQTKWMTQKYPTYTQAWNKGVKALRSTRHDVTDICVVSSRYFFEPPIAEVKQLRNKRTKEIVTREIYWLPDPPFEWCWRCRRPTTFTSLPPNHHALRYQPVVSPDSPWRCWYCGIRRVAMPSTRHYNFLAADNRRIAA